MATFPNSAFACARAPRPRRIVQALFAAQVGLAAGAAMAQSVADCMGVIDPQRRLACYDELFAPPPALPATPSDAPMAAPEPELTRPAVDTVGEPLGRASGVLRNAWELTPPTKRGTFTVRTYQPNFVLPAYYSSDINRTPSSPTRGATAGNRNYRNVEAKIQVSLRTKVAEGLVLPNADLWFAYTQRSLWQVWTPSESSPFRSTDYQPEAFYVLPVSDRFGSWPGGWRWELLQFGIAHQSNGQAEPFSRSWNRGYIGTAFTRGDFAIEARFNKRLREDLDEDDNPRLTRFIGNTELTGSWYPGVATSSLTWRLHPDALDKGSLQFDWTYPVDRAQPQGLRWYMQLFSGYGESLLDYNHRQNRIGFGLTLFQL